MTFLLPLVALALAFAAPFLLRPERETFAPSRLGVWAVLVAIGVVVVARGAPAADRTPAMIGLLMGALAPALGAWTGGFAPGVAAAAGLHLFPSNPSIGLALVAGTGLGALTLGGEASALAATLVFVADDLGSRHSGVPAAAFIGSQIGVALAVGAFVAALLPKGVAPFRPILVGVLAVVGALVSGRALGDESATLCAGLGALAGVVLHFLMPKEEGESSRIGLAAIVGVGLATVAYGLGRGMGMGLAALAAVGVLLAADNRRAVLALGPLVGLVLYRVLREAGTGATRALDIAQHYTLLALIVGLTLPLLPSDWLRTRTSAIGTVLWGIVAIAAAPLLVAALGMRGGIGFVVGLGTCGLAQALRNGERGTRSAERSDTDEMPNSTLPTQNSPLLPLALGAGIGGSTILALAWLGDESTLARDAKLHLFAYAAVGLAVIAGILAFLSRPKGEVR